MRSVVRVLIALCVAMSLAGCGGADAKKSERVERPSEAEWRAGVEDVIGHPFRNDAAWESYKKLYRGSDGWCSQSADDLAMALAVGLDSNESVSDQERQLKLACPDRSKIIDAAVKDVQDSSAKADRICGSDPQLLNAEDRDYYDAVC